MMIGPRLVSGLAALAVLAAFLSVGSSGANDTIDNDEASSASTAPLFADGFEEGDLSRWTFASGLSVQNAEVRSGSFAARAASSGSPTYAYETLGEATPELYARVAFKVISRETSATLLAFSRSNGTRVVRVFLDASGRLAYRNEAKGTTLTSTTVVQPGAWHVLDARVSISSASVVEVHLNGVPAVSGAEPLSGLMRQLQLGDHGTGRRYDLVFDDVAVDRVPIGSVEAPPTKPTNLALVGAPGDTVHLRWDVSRGGAGIASYVVYRDNVEVATVPGTSTEHVDAPPSRDSVYSYTVLAIDASGQSSERSASLLVTMPNFTRPSDAIIFAAGDIACASTTPTATSCWQRATSDIFVDHPPDAVLALGDVQYEKATLESLNKSFHPTWGRAKPSILPTTGNHEYNTPGASGYFDYFGPSSGDRSLGYYSTDVGGWHLIALNSNCNVVPCGPGSAQEAWLQQDLAAHPVACTLAYFHRPIWSSRHGTNTSLGALMEALHQSGAELVLTAHDHLYERLAPQTPAGVLDREAGIRQFTVGTGGRSLYTFLMQLPNSEARDNTTFGLLKLSLHPTSYDWSFVPAWGHGSFTDHGSASCR